jgi:SPP1 gp7 family putative phage head morphogenesis protein
MFDWFKSKNVDDFSLFTMDEMDMYNLFVYHGIINKNALSADYHAKIASYFEKALFEGMGGDASTLPINSRIFKSANSLRKSLYIFSAAKQYSQVREMEAGLKKLSGMIDESQKFKTFKEEASKIFESYNKNYLKTEYNTAVGQSQMARDYVDAIEYSTPLLQYRTQRDKRVRDEHAILDGITLPPDDPFWRYNMPKNGWNCRCFTIPLEKGKKTDLSKIDLSDLEDEKKFPKLFRMNPAIDGYIFDPKQHPYFHVAKGDANFKKANYNLFVP